MVFWSCNLSYRPHEGLELKYKENMKEMKNAFTCGSKTEIQLSDSPMILIWEVHSPLSLLLWVRLILFSRVISWEDEYLYRLYSRAASILMLTYISVSAKCQLASLRNKGRPFLSSINFMKLIRQRDLVRT
jgi:hypothetical protein